MNTTLLHGRNNLLSVNPDVANGETVSIAQTVYRSDFYYAICAIMDTVVLGLIGASFATPRTDEIFSYISAAINMPSCCAYLAMDSDVGWTPIDIECRRPDDDEFAGTNRQIMFVRYIDRVITTALLLMDLILTAAMPWPTFIRTVFLNQVMAVTGLAGALVSIRYRFCFYLFGCAAMLAIFHGLAGAGRRHARAL